MKAPRQPPRFAIDPPVRRGRPMKFGRPSQLVAVSLPDDVVAALRAVHANLGWAIVKVCEPLLTLPSRQPRDLVRASPELAPLPGRRALIVVNESESIFRKLPGVTTIPLGEGRAFLAFDDDESLNGLELAVIDRLEACAPGSPERPRLERWRRQLREWRNEKGLHFRKKTIVVVEGVAR